MAFAPPLFAAFIRQLGKAVDDTKAEYKMSVQVSGLADIVRQAKRAIDTAGDAAQRLNASATAVVNTIGQVDQMTSQLDAANADLQAAVGAMTNGDPNPGPLPGTTASVTASPVAGVAPLTPAEQNTAPQAAPLGADSVHQAKVVVEHANAEPAYVPRPVVSASTIAAANAAAALNK